MKKVKILSAIVAALFVAVSSFTTKSFSPTDYQLRAPATFDAIENVKTYQVALTTVGGCDVATQSDFCKVAIDIAQTSAVTVEDLGGGLYEIEVDLDLYDGPGSSTEPQLVPASQGFIWVQ